MKIVFIILILLFIIGTLLFFMSVINAERSENIKTAYIGMGLVTFSWVLIIIYGIYIFVDRYLL